MIADPQAPVVGGGFVMPGEQARYFQWKCTKMRPKFLLSFSIR